MSHHIIVVSHGDCTASNHSDLIVSIVQVHQRVLQYETVLNTVHIERRCGGENVSHQLQHRPRSQDPDLDSARR